jgi:hypothetical protein
VRVTNEEAVESNITDEQPKSLFIILGIVFILYGLSAIINHYDRDPLLPISFIYNLYLMPVAGIILVITGIICLKVRHRVLLLISGIVYLLAGLLSIYLFYISPGMAEFDVIYSMRFNYLIFMLFTFGFYDLLLFNSSLCWLSFRNYKKAVRYDRISIILLATGTLFFILGFLIAFYLSPPRDLLSRLLDISPNAIVLWVAIRSYKKAKPWDMRSERPKSLRFTLGTVLTLYAVCLAILGSLSKHNLSMIIFAALIMVIALLCFILKHSALFIVAGITFFLACYFCYMFELIFARPTLNQFFTSDLNFLKLGEDELQAIIPIISASLSIYSFFFLNASLSWLSFRNIKKSTGYNRFSVILLCGGIILSILGLVPLLYFSSSTIKLWRIAWTSLVTLIPLTVLLFIVARSYKKQKSMAGRMNEA